MPGSKSGIGLVALVLSGVLWGCAIQKRMVPPPGVPPRVIPSDVREIDMTARDFSYTPSELTVTPGQKVLVRLHNEGPSSHSLVFELPSGNVALPVILAFGETAEVEFVAPSDAGNYSYYCPVGNHRQEGMFGTLVVQK